MGGGRDISHSLFNLFISVGRHPGQARMDVSGPCPASRADCISSEAVQEFHIICDEKLISPWQDGWGISSAVLRRYRTGLALCQPSWYVTQQAIHQSHGLMSDLVWKLSLDKYSLIRGDSGVLTIIHHCASFMAWSTSRLELCNIFGQGSEPLRILLSSAEDNQPPIRVPNVILSNILFGWSTPIIRTATSMTIMFAHSTHKPMISTRGSHYQGANTDYCAPDLANAYLRTTHIVDHFMLMFLIELTQCTFYFLRQMEILSLVLHIE